MLHVETAARAVLVAVFAAASVVNAAVGLCYI